MLTVCATRLDAAVPSLQERMDTFMCAYGHVIGGAPPRRRGRSTRAAARRVPTRRRPKARAQK
jgi:hypothetical protein